MPHTDAPVAADLAAGRARVASGLREVADEVRSLLVAQRPVWQQLPWLWLLGEGKTGYTDAAERLYGTGRYRPAPETSWTVELDCATGLLVASDGSPAGDGRYVQVASMVAAGGRLDAATAVVKAAERAAGPIHSYMTRSAAELARWQLQRIAEFRLTPRFRCAQVCPGCPDARFNVTVLGLVDGGWDHSVEELVAAARALTAPR